MFEGLVASLLNRYLSDYIDEVDYNNLKLGIFSGTLELLNIKVKPSAMYQFDLPVDVKGGTIGRLKINISWRNILTKPAVAVLEDLFVLLGPFEDKINDPARIEELSLVHKRKQLHDFEKLDQREIVESKERGYAEKVQDTIINNIQVYVKNVHIRYEDKHSLKDKSISFGVYLKEFKAETVDEDNQPNFMNAEAKIIYKLGSLSGFNMYWNCDFGQPNELLISSTKNFDPLDNNWIDLMKNSIDSNKIFRSKFCNFLENDLDLTTRLTIRRSYETSDSNLPRITIQSSVQSIEFVFHRLQYKSILQLVDHYSMLNLHKKYVKYRPGEIGDKKLRARAWWKFAFTANAETTWRQFRKDRMLAHFKNYKLYMRKYEEKLKAQQMGQDLEKKKLDYLEKLERDLVLESIFDIRNMLINKYKINNESQTKENQTDIFDRPLNYVQFRLILNFPLISIKLKNAQNEILCLNLKSLISRLELKPVQNSVYFLLNTQGLELYGIHYTDRIESARLVPIIKSSHEHKSLDLPATYLASENAKDMLFVFCFETNPTKYENCEFSIRTRIASLEVYYEKTSISELMRFFKTDLVDFGEVRKIKEVWSKAGVIYAVENHKQFHIVAELASPYFIIPSKGTCTQPNDSIIFFLGKTLIQSRVQPKQSNYTPESVEDLEKNFYDKLSMSVKEVQVLLVPTDVEWKSYFENYKELNYCHHLLYPVSTKNYLYLSINPSYKKLPKLKLETDCSSIRLNFSNDKIISLYEFGKNFPLPELPKSSGQNELEVNSAHSNQQLKRTTPTSSTTTSTGVNKRSDKMSVDKRSYYTKSGTEEIEPDDEWDGPFNLPKYINGDPIANYSQITCRFTISDFSIDLNQSHAEYLHFIFKSIKIDFVIAKYGIFLRSGLDDLKLIDKIHESSQQDQYTEILSSSNQYESNQIIKFYFRQIDPEVPNFDTLYSKIITNILFDCSNIHVKCHRTAIVYFLNYFKSTIERIERDNANTQMETIVDKSKIVAKNSTQNSNVPLDSCQFNLVAKMNKLTWNMFDNRVKFGDMIVKQLSVCYNISSRAKTDLKVQLSKILINYGDEMEKLRKMYRQIISCTGDESNGKFFDFNVILYDRSKQNKLTSNTNSGYLDYDEREKEEDELRDELRLNVGKIKVICLVKFVNELVEFIDPIINPLPSALTEQVKEQAFEAVKQAYEETKSDKGNKIYLNVFITSPQVIIPRNSHSLNAFICDLGTVIVKNKFIDQDYKNVLSNIQSIDLHLSNLEIKRVVYKENTDACDVMEQVIRPISLNCVLKMPIKNLQPDIYPDADISACLEQVELLVSLETAKLLFAILAENLNEGISNNKHENVELIEQQKVIRKDDRPTGKSLETTKSTSQRITLKMNFDLNQIKLIIVDFVESNPTGNKRRNWAITSNSSSREESTDFQSVKSNSELSNVESDHSSRVKHRAKITYFSHFEIETIGFKYYKCENSSWTADLNMKSLVLNDVRPDSNLAVKEMFISSKEEDFLKISYQFEPPGNARLDFFLDNLKINLCLPYVLKIYKFAMDAIGTTNKTEIKIDSVTKNRQDSRTDQLEKDQTESSLNVYGRISLKEVVLFAQPEKLNSQILIMEAELVLKFDSINTMSNLEIDLINLSLRLGEHNLRRQGIPFLSPCKGKISMHQIDPKKPARYLAKIDSLFFNMTQTLYEVVMGVVTSINQTGTEQVQKIADNEQLLDDAEPFVKRSIDPSNYETCARPQDEIENQSSTIEYVKNAFNKVTEVLDLKIGGAYITFCEETPIDLQPLAIFKIQLEGQVANWSKNLHTKASLTLEASYYNDILSNWEPLVEHNMQKEDNYRPWILSIWFALEPGGTVQPSIEVKGVPTIEFPVKELDYSEIENEIPNHRTIDDNLSQEINIEEQMDEKEKKRKKAGLFKRKKKTKQAYSENFEQEIVGDEIQQQPLSIDETKNASYILVESNDLLNINITPSAYKVCMYLSSITSGSQREFMEGNLKAPLKFLNFLGEECDLILNNRQSVKSENAIGFNVKYEEMNTRVNSMDNDPNKRIEKIMLNSQRSQIDMIYNENYKFTFCLANFEKCRLSMKNDGSFLFPLRIRNQLDTHSDSPLVKENIKYNVMYKVRTLYGRQKIIISSPLQIENYTQISLFVWVEMTRLLCEYKSKFNFIDQITHGDKAYVALFRLLPNKVYYVPLYIAYNCKIYVSPDNKMFAPSQIFDLRGYNLRVEDYSQAVCESIDNQQDFNLLRKLSLNVRSHRNVMPAMHANYRVSLYTAIRLVNSLPFQIRLDIDQDEQVLFNPTMEPGDILSLNLNALNVASIRIHLLNYLNASWFGKLTLSEVIQSNTDRFRIKMNLSPTTEMLVTGKHLNICVTYKHPNEFVIYSPYWLINKSGQPIKIRTTDDLRTYSIPDDSILLFDFQQVRKDNKVRLTIKEGSWSRPFSFETVGTTGMIQCSDIHQTYNFLMRITMSNSNRTKLVTFAPFLTVANNLDEPVWIREWHGNEKKTAKHHWIRVDKTDDDNKPIGLWPKLVGESKQVKFVLKILDGRITQPFNLENPARFVLILSDSDQSYEQMNQQQNLTVEASSKILTVLISGGNQNPVTIVVRKYQYGDAIAKFLNLCDDLHISILNNNLMWNIEPFSSMFFVWPDLDNRVLQWTVNNCSKSEVLKLTKSGTETCTFSISIEKNESSALYNSDNDHDMGAKSNLIKANQGLNKQGQRQVQVCCVSYLEDGQRCIVFTTDKSLAEFEQKKEASNLELFMSIRGIQLSIINNVNLEISTVYIRGSNSSWEIHNEDEIRVFTKEYSEWLELMYANFLFNLHSVESLKHKALLNNDNLQQAEYLNEKFHINFKKMIIYKPEPGRLVRNYHPGLIVQYRASANMTSIKCCVFNIQVDNQLPDAYFPIVLYKSPIRLIDDSQLIPYVTLSIFKELQNVTEIYRYFECIIQEFYLKADKGFLLSLKDWYEAATYTSSIEDMTFDLSANNEIEADNVLILIDEDKSVQERINLDIKLSKEIMEYANKTGTIKQSAHIRFEEFYLSPMLFNMSFSMNGEAHTDDKVRSDSNAASDYLFNFFLESIGTSLTEFKDVKFSFNQFDMINETKTWTEMYDTLFDHYKVQALRQAYVLIFGLDVLGNPFGLVSDFSEGFTSIFYDPLVDYLSGRDRADKVDIEFTTKLKLALYKSVSSAAGSGSLITGTIGRVLATFSFDKKYKKKRQYKISKLSTSTLSNTVSNASKGIVQGVIYGITGLVNNPLEERKRGTKALIAGMGKGLAGFVSKPVGSVFDGVSISLDGLKRFALSGSEPITNIRLPRHLINDVSILPYSAYQAKGYEILRDLQNDNIAQEEFYWAHLFLQNKRRRSLLFITDAHIYRLKKTSTQILKQWKLLQDPIQLHKVTTSTIVAFEMPQNLTSKQRKALENCLLAKSLKESDLHQFYITYKKDTENYDLNVDNSKMLLLISQKSACQWLNDKIQSAIKYYKELKNYIEIV